MFGRNRLGLIFTADFSFFDLSGSGMKHVHSRSVSSAAALITVEPSGDIAICKTRAVCPVSSACFTIDGYFQMVN